MKTADLNDVLHHDQLDAVFQPIVAADELTVVGYEGLIRGPAGSTLESPGQLFAAARASNRQLELETRCVRTVLARFSALRLPGKLFLNVSAATLLAPAAQHRALIDELHRHDVDSRRIVIELTEDQAIYDFRRLRRMARFLRRQGFSLAIDDLGAGYASLRLWLELRPNFVKIDIAFVRGSERDAVKQAFLGAIRDIAHASGSLVVAEGIETAAEMAVVQRLGIDCGQGYHIDRRLEEV
ncbi:EAL domain-containing protein [Oxalobacteraceae bacterium OM1]|nr:EAL domain-containing protein [Oxalobacteraceae bacterium OM1]